MSKLSKLEPYKEIIFSLKQKGKSCRIISEHLKNEFDFEIHPRTIFDFLKKHYTHSVFESKLEESNFSPKSNWSHGWLKTKEASIFIKNKEGIISFDEMRAKFITEMSNYSPTYKKVKRKPITDKHLLVIDIADLHIGKLADKSETGDSYNTDIGVKRALEGVNGILSKAKGFPIDKILFIIGNDVLHIDNANKSTSAGTTQDVDGMWYKNYEIARDLYIKIIEMLVNVADVHIVHNPSNHDYISGFMLADSVYCWFRKHKNITFDVSNSHRKYFTYGKNLIGSSHGDGAKMQDMPLLMANEAPLQWANTFYRYIYLHHIHHKDVTKFKSGKDYQGVTVEYLRSPSGTDSWHHRNGYQHAPKAIEAFIHSKNFGQVARLTHLFK
tara:strand:+ start:1817 stop:2968 length:1152 start_codon:yes stop_codon:yes gene_type:complete